MGKDLSVYCDGVKIEPSGTYRVMVELSNVDVDEIISEIRTYVTKDILDDIIEGYGGVEEVLKNISDENIMERTNQIGWEEYLDYVGVSKEDLENYISETF
jgi:hypothetical protein